MSRCIDEGKHEGDTWPLHDARGIYVTRVCKRCQRTIMGEYRPEIFSDPNYQADEDIEPDI